MSEVVVTRGSHFGCPSPIWHVSWEEEAVARVCLFGRLHALSSESIGFLSELGNYKLRLYPHPD